MRHEDVGPSDLDGWTADLLPPPGALASDVRAGTGCDAVWLAAAAWAVALEPSAAVRATCEQLHGDLGVRLVDGSLPFLEVAARSGLASASSSSLAYVGTCRLPIALGRSPS